MINLKEVILLAESVSLTMILIMVVGLVIALAVIDFIRKYWMLKAIECPHCFESFNVKKLLFRCRGGTCLIQNDAEWARHLGQSVKETYRVITPTNSEIKRGSTTCPREDGGCGEETYKHLCPHCHSEIPQNPWKNPYHILTVVGSTASGKSTFIAVSMDQTLKDFMGTFGSNTNIIFNTEDAAELWLTRFKRPMDEGGLETTQERALNPDVRRPLSYYLKTWQYRKFAQPLKKVSETNLILYDTPGEDFNEKKDAHGLKSVSRSNALIYFVDILTFEGVANALNEPRPSSQNPADVLDTFADVYCLQNPDMTIGDKIKVPVAVVLSKVDLIQNYLQNNIILEEAYHQGGIDLDNLEQTSKEVEKIIKQFGGGSFIDKVAARFENFLFFGVSSGTLEGTVFTPRPHRILDPLIWLMYETDLIPKKPEK